MSLPIAIHRDKGFLPPLPPGGAFPFSKSPSASKGSPKLQMDDETASAKKLFKRLLYDPNLDDAGSSISVGFIETHEETRGRGSESWSLRQHRHVRVVPLSEFIATFSDDSDGGVPYHRIALFRDNQTGAVLWERKAYTRAPPGNGDRDAARPTGGASGAAGLGQNPYGSPPPLPPARGASPPLGPGPSGLARAFAALKMHQGSPEPAAGGLGFASAAHASPGDQYSASARSSPSRSFGAGTRLDFGAAAAHAHAAQGRSPDNGPALAQEASGPSQAPGSPGHSEGACPEATSEWEDEDEASWEEEAEGADLPDDCWRIILDQLPVRELCMMARVSTRLRGLTRDSALWAARYRELYGETPAAGMDASLVRRLCRRTELAAARWRDAAPQMLRTGFAHTACVALDETKVVSGDGPCVRLWSPTSGRRLQTLSGHHGRVTACTFDDDTILSGCSSSQVRLWSMDEGRSTRLLKGHTGPISGLCLLGGMPISASEDGTVRLWDAALGQTVMTLEGDAGHPTGAIKSLAINRATSRLYTGASHISVWDLETAQLAMGLALPDHPLGPYTTLSVEGPLLAAGCRGAIGLFDTRAGTPISSLSVLRTAAAAPRRAEEFAGAGSPPAGPSGAAAMSDAIGQPVGVAGLQLDGWKLIAAARDGPGSLRLYDIRALEKDPAKSWQKPVMELFTGGAVSCFAASGPFLLAGLEGNTPAALWSFGPRCHSTLAPPRDAGAAGTSRGEPAAGSSPGDGHGHGHGHRSDSDSESEGWESGGYGSGARRENSSRRKDKDKDKPKKRSVKPSNRYPKRSTR